LRQLRLFGPLRLSSSGQALALHGAKARSLLAYLALFPATNTSRERLADLFWPEAPPNRSRRLLSNLLYEIRQALGPDWLVADSDQVWLNHDDLWLDVAEFKRLLRTGDPDSLAQAIALYADDLLPDLYDDWLMAPRLEWREAYLSALETLVEAHRARNDLGNALNLAQRMVLAEPLREENQQTYLRLLGRQGRRNEALAHYDYLVRLLRDELDVAPLPDTQALAAAIRRESEQERPNAPQAESLPLVGRAAERERLIHGLEQTLRGNGVIIALEGDPGIGKSRLLREAATSARWRGLLPLSGAATPLPHEPLAPLAQALAGLSLAQVHALTADLPPETRAACADLIPAWRDAALLTKLPPQPRLARLFQASGDLFAALTQQMPLCLLLDDLHYSHPDLWPLLDLLARRTTDLPLCLILAYCPAEMSTHPSRPRLAAWEQAGWLSMLTLAPLSTTEAAQMIPTRYTAEREQLYSLSAGNPFWLTQALVALDEGHPPTASVVARADQLPPAARAALDAAAVLGLRFGWALWGAAAGVQDLLPLANILIQHRFLQPTTNGYAFVHELVQTALYDHLAPARRCDLHGRAAVALDRLSPDSLLERAWHHDQAGEAGLAAALYRRLAEQLRRRAAYTTAQEALRRALELTPDEDATHFDLLLELVQLTFIVEEGAQQAALIERLLHLADHLADPAALARAALVAGEWAWKSGQPDASEAHLAAAVAHAQAAARPDLQAEALGQLAHLTLRQGDTSAAQTHYRQQLALVQKASDLAQEAAALEGLGLVMGNSGGPSDEVLGYLQRSLEIRCTLDNAYEEAQSRNTLLSALQAAGRLDEVLALGEETLALNRSIDYGRGVALAQATLAQTAAALGDFEQARLRILEARAYAERVNDNDGLGQYTGILGLITERGGDPAGAEAFYRAAIERLDRSGASYFAALTRRDLGRLLVRQDRPAEALPTLEQAISVFETRGEPLELARCRALRGLALWRIGEQALARSIAAECWLAFQERQTQADGGEEQPYSLWALWQLLAAVGRDQAAQAVLRHAYAALQHQASLLTEPDLRHSFFANVPVNREIAAAYGDLTRSAPAQTARLARRDIPLGRPLAASDYVTITWTPHAPEDDLIRDKGQRRRAALRRLLAEAEAQGAAPTDDDLAAALDVSRHTVLRDMAVLAEQGIYLPTRKRKS
jgi:DNA-binding SARP family transcriptional activator